MTNLQRILNLVLLPLVIILSFLFVKGMIANKPERQVKKPPVVIPNVSYVESSLQSVTPSLTTYGNVRSYHEASLSAQVEGEIVSVDPAFNSGQMVSKDEVLLEIDQADYLADIAQQEAALASAKQALAEEMIRSQLAAEDWVESGRDLGDATDLTLRKPQLSAAKASVASAEASLRKAKLDLESTRVIAPFDAIVQSRTTSLGNYVRVGDALGVIVSKERAEVRLPLTPDQIRRIDLPMDGRKGNSDTELIATLTSPSQPGVSWEASIARTEPNVDPQNQVVYVIGEIEAPFADPNAFLPIGAFVDAVIPARELSDVYLIPETSLVEDSYIWLIDETDQLMKQRVKRLVAHGRRLVVETEFSDGGVPLKVATRPLASFREGQTVKPLLLTE